MSTRTQAKSPAGGGLRMVTGTYTGDGAASQAIVVGLQPKFVWIYVQDVILGFLSTPGGKVDIDQGPALGDGNIFFLRATDDVEYYHPTGSIDPVGFTITGLFNLAGEIYTYICFT